MKHFLIYSLFITLSFLVNSCEEGFKDESSVFSLELKELIAINSPTRDTTPDYTFSSNIAGSIKYAGLCSSSTTVASLGANTITLDPLVNGTYSDCSITVESEDIWLIGSLKLSSFIVLDPTAPTIAEVTIVTSPTNDSTPNYTFYSDQAGTITYGGSCSSSTTSAIIGNTTITLVPLSDGTYSDCTINVTNASGIVSDSITITSFVVDSAAATLAEVTAVITPNNDPTPNYTFSSDQAGTITYGGSCSSVTTSAINGNTTITLRSLSDGTYSDCTVTVTDAASNSVTLNMSSFTVDTTAPTVSSFTFSDTDLKTNDTATVTLVFSEAVASFSSYDDITVVNGSLAAMTSNNNITWSGIFTPTANTEDWDNMLWLGTSYTDSVGNTGTAAVTSNYKVDDNDPSVTSFTLSDSALKAGDTPTVTLVFSEKVASFSSADDITVANGTLTTMTSSDDKTWTGTFTPTANTEDANNTFSLATSYTDTVGNTGPTATTANYAVETLAPSVTSFTLSDTVLNAGDTPTLTLVFSEKVASFSSAADITVANGTLSAMSSSDDTTWTGTFTPTANTDDANNILSLASSYTDVAGNTGPTATTANYEVDTIYPTVSSVAITSATGILNNLLNPGDVVSVTANFSESVIIDNTSGTPTLTFVVGSTDQTATYTSGSGGTTLVFKYTIQAGDNDSDGISIGANVLALNSGTIKDVAGNNATLTHSAVSANTSYKADTAAPTASWSAATDNVGTVTGALSSGDTTDDPTIVLSGTNEAGSSVKVYDNTTELGSATVTGTSWSFSATVARATTYQFNVKETDLAGNTSVATSNFALTGDTDSPTVSSVVITSATGILNNLLNVGDVLSVTLTFSKNVLVSGFPQMTLVVGSTDQTSTYTSGSGSTALVFQYTIQAGETDTDGISIGANVLALNSGTLRDAAGNSATLTHSAMPANTSYKVDTTAPTVNTFTLSDTELKIGDNATVTLVLSEAVASFSSAADITVTSGTLATMTSTDNITWSGTFTPTSNIEDASNTLSLATSYTDTAGNAGPAATTSNYEVDTTAPSVNSFTLSDTALKAGDNATVTLEFSETVASFSSSADITVNNGTLATMTSSDNITWTGTFTPTTNTEDASNTLSLATSYADTAGNGGPAATTANYEVETLVPTVSSVAITSATGIQNNLLNTGDVISFTSTFSENVLVTGFPKITLVVGSTDRSATYTSGSGSTALVFKYTILTGETDTDGISIGANVLALNSGTLRDAAGNNATLTHSSLSANTSYKVDTTAPTATWSAATDNVGTVTGALTSGDTTDDTALILSGTNEAGSSVKIYNSTTELGNATVSGTSWSYTATVANGTTYQFNVKETDLAGNTSVATNDFGVTGDTTAPTANLSAATDNVGNITGTLTTGDTTDDTALVLSGTNESGSSVKVYNGTTELDNATVSGTSWSYTATLVDGTTYQFNVKETDLAGNTSNPTPNFAVTGDTTPPTVSSVAITSATGILNNFLNATDVLSVTITFDENVPVTGTPQLPLVIGADNRTATYTTGSGSTALVFKYTIQAGDTDTDGISIGANVLALNSGTIWDAAGNNAILTHSAVSDNESYMVDTTAPTVNSFTLSDSALKIGENATVSLVFSDVVISFSSAADITAPNGSLTTFTSSDNITWSGTFTPTTNIEDASNTLALGTNYSDPAGNTGPAATTANYEVETLAPTVSSIVISGATGIQNNFLNAGDNVSVTTTFSENVAVTGSPTLTIVVGSTNRTVTYTSGSGGRTLVFKYTIQGGETDTNGISIGTNGLALNSGTIMDAAGNNATLTHSAVSSNSSYKVDTTPPTISSVAITSATNDQNNFLNAGDIASLTTTFSESVNVTDAPQLTMIVGSTDRVSTYTSGSGSTSLITKYTIQAGETDEDGISIGANVLALNSGTIQDPAGNNATLTHSAVSANSSFMVDTTSPTVDSFTLSDTQLLIGETATVGLDFSEKVILFTNADITAPNGTLATMTSSDATTWTGTFTPNTNTEVPSNTLSLGTIYTDLAGNTGTVSTTANYEVETYAPSAIFTIYNTKMKENETSQVDLVFREPVLLFSNSDITFPDLDNGTVSGTLSTMTSSDNITWTGTFSPTFPETQDWTNAFTLASSYTDIVGNTGTAQTSVNFMIDDIEPTTIPTITLADTTHLYRQLVWLTVVFPEPVDPSTFNNSDIDITDANGTLVSSMGSSDGNITWRAYFRPTDNIEDVSNTISLGTAWTDQVGNAGIAAISSNFEVETTIPTADNFTISVAQGTTYTNTSSIDSALKPGDNATLTLVFSEVVNGFSSSTDIVTPNVTLTAMTSSDNITWTGNFTPTDNIADITNTITLYNASYQDIAGNNGTSKTSLNFVVDTKAPSASSISPVNNACIPITDNIAVTFDFHMEPSYLTTSTSDTNCAGSMRLSADNFSTCVQMSAEPAASSVKQRFTLNPSDNLSYNTTYNIKVTTAAKSILGNALSTQYDSSFITSLAPSSVSGLFMAVGNDGETLRSDDNGSSWVSTNCQFTNSNDFNAVTFGNNTYVGVGNSGLSRRSTDTGANFSTANTGSGSNHLYGLTFGNNTFVGVGASGHIRRSTDDGASFPSVSSGYGGYLRGVTFGNNIFAAVGQSGKILRSTNNGASWSNATSPITTYLYGVAYGNNTFVAVGKKGKIVRSTDYGASWDNATSPITTYLNGVAFGNNTFVAVGQSGKILRSTDAGASWNNETSPITTYLRGVTFSE